MKSKPSKAPKGLSNLILSGKYALNTLMMLNENIPGINKRKGIYILRKL